MPESKEPAKQPWHERHELALSIVNQVASMVLTALTVITAPHFEELEKGTDAGVARSVVVWCVVAAVLWAGYLAFLIWHEVVKSRTRSKREDELASLRGLVVEMEGQRAVIA